MFRALVTSRIEEAFNPAKALSIEASWTVFSSGSGLTFHSNILPAYDFYLVSYPLFIFTDLFSMLLVLLSEVVVSNSDYKSFKIESLGRERRNILVWSLWGCTLEEVYSQCLGWVSMECSWCLV
jgi:hypothetical protein